MYDFTSEYGYILGGLLAFVAIFVLIALAVAIVMIIANWMVFKKAGKGGWESIVPFYNYWVLFEISDLNWWWFLIYLSPMILALVPILNIVSGLAALASMFAQFNCNFNLAKKFSKGTGFAICLTLFPYVCFPILGFSKNSKYNSNIQVSNNGVFDASSNNNSNNMNNNNNFQQNYNNPNNVNTDNNLTNNYSFCANCGTKLDNDTKFCPNCGKQNI